jgi:histidyl-tRNA synthetase
MGDVVLGEVIKKIPSAHEAMQKAIASDRKIDIYIVIAKEERRADALKQIQQLRDRGYRVDYPLAATKVTRQFQAAEEASASVAVLYGDEWPQLKVKDMTTGEQKLVTKDDFTSRVESILR